MSNVISIPKVNPLKIYHQNEVFASRSGDNYKAFKPWQNSRNIDEDFYLPNVAEWLNDKPYYQPWQNSDVICLNFTGLNKISGTVPYLIRLIDCKGTVIKSITATWIDDIGTQSIYSAEIKLWDIEQGIYGVQIRFQDTINAGVPWEYFISEPIEVKEFHKGTKLIKYKCTDNAFGVYYEEGARFMIRVHAELIEFKPDSKFEVYEDDPHNLEQLGGESYREMTLAIGGNGNPIPDWLIDKLEPISIHEYLSIEGVQYTRNEGVKFDIERNKSTSLSSIKLNVRERYTQNSFSVQTFNHVDIMASVPNDYFYVEEIEFPNAGAGVTISIQNYFKNAQQFINYLNQEIEYIYGLTWSTEGCYVAISAEGAITFFVDNTTDESKVEDASVNGVIDNYVSILVELDGAGGTDIDLDFVTAIPTSTKYAVFLNDGTAKDIDTNATGSFTYGHTFLQSCRAFYFLEGFDGLEITGHSIVKGIRAKLPSTATDFNITSNAVKYVENNIFKAPVLQNVGLAQNDLSTSQIDNAVIMAYEALNEGYLTSACTIDLSGQSSLSNNEGMRTITQTLNSNSITISI